MNEILPIITKNGETYSIKPRGDFAESAAAWASLLQKVNENLVTKHVPEFAPPAAEASEDILERLESEMVHEKISEGQKLHLSLQDYVLNNFLEELKTNKEATVDAENMIVLSRALNRIYFTLRSIGPELQIETENDPLVILSSIWSVEILKARVL